MKIELEKYQINAVEELLTKVEKSILSGNDSTHS